MINKRNFLTVMLLIFLITSTLFAKPQVNPGIRVINKDTLEFTLKKFKEGIDFYATGNEPFWTLDIAINQFIHFNILNGLSVNTGSVKGEKAMDANVIRYATQTDIGFFSVTISQRDCSDNMSGEKFSYKVFVEINNPGDTNYKRFEGCGRYVPNYSLNRKWTLKKIGDKEVSASDYINGVPELNIDIESSRFSGMAGCNRMTGSLWAEYNLIRFSDPAMTMMACQQMDLESEFLQALKKTTQYKILRDDLLLSNPDGTTLVFYDPDFTEAESYDNDNDTSRIYRLNDIWVLESLNGVEIDMSKYRNGLPQLEINVDEMNFYGSGGCNQISGYIKIYGSSIKFGPVASTRMLCEGVNEAEFLNALQDANSWKIEKNKLYLMQDGKTVLVLKKTD